MPQPRIRFYPDAVLEAEAAFNWYLEKSPFAARAFLNELDHALARVANFPERWPKYYGSCRRYIFPRFPFQLIYRIAEDSVEILAVAHGRRRPYYWKSRT